MRNVLRIVPLIALLGGCATLGQSETPHKYGATTAPRVAIVNGSNTPLPSYQFSDMPVGLIVMDTTGQNWQLTASTSAVNHTSVEAVTSNPGLRWLTYSGGGSGTITTSAPLSGNGSAGTPATIAAGAITNTYLATPPQPSSSVAITGGTITGVNTATTSVQGAMSAADKALADFTNGMDIVVEENFLKSKVSALTGFHPIRIGDNPAEVVIGATAQDGLTEGGSLTNVTTGLSKFTPTIFQTPKTGKWGLCARTKMIVPTSSHTARFGAINAGNTHAVDFGSMILVDATNYVLRSINGTTNPTAVGNIPVDSSFHWLCTVADGTNMKLYVDNVDSTASIAQSTLASDEGIATFMTGTATSDVTVSVIVYGFVKP